MVDMVENILEAARTVTRTAEIVKTTRPAGAVQQRAGPAPARGRKRPPPPPRPDWPALKDRIIGWMAEGLQGQQVYGRRLRQTFGSGARRVDVEAEHLLDDY